MYVYDFEVQSTFSGRVIHIENLSLHEFKEYLVWLCNMCGADQPWMHRRFIYIDALRRHMCRNPAFTNFVYYCRRVSG